ncbi:kinase-like protein [Dothidotthia symphoricarpi CBS 119687]|uniref:Kinase-like protein n=1 Tax=Dothidotthia symphoricarpi CBS 119687 TaxID=1392245 RepID=A0A6A6AAW5_9PLEO|nr:kinase-like protein [Dothidotthia symphoricarpi CBS 119687]KAF2128353.1 kinase-like protein [Dothidotthia symphoricarpi CBS 119687]
MAGERVAWFEVRAAGQDSYEIPDTIDIRGNEQFHLGRDPELCYRYYWSDITISRRHLRVHCILYEQDPIADIAPFVYATDLSVNGTHLKKHDSDHIGSPGMGILMGRNSTFLLDHGDELRLSESVTLVYYSDNPVQVTRLTRIQEQEKSLFASRYLITGRLLGEGGYGKVLIGVQQETQRQLACKMVRLDHLFSRLSGASLRQPSGERGREASDTWKRWPTRIANNFREFDILKDISHPNIATVQKVFWSQHTIYMFQELVTGGDLFSFIEYKGGRINSVCASVIIRQILIGVEYLHAQDIVHRDLKPDNILMTSLDDGARVVITDFGSARFLPNAKKSRDVQATKLQRMFSVAGTLEFAAPEIHRANPTIPAEQGYSKGVDMWSVGTITAAILSGENIFSSNARAEYRSVSRNAIMDHAARCDLSVLDSEYHPTWSSIKNDPKDFIKRLLVLEEEQRMTASQALAHPWFCRAVYAADFEALYERCIKDWHPRHKDHQLVEAISTTGIPDHKLQQESVSRFFSQSQPDPTHDILRSLSSSQCWRANTPLPSIRKDYEDTQFASQVIPSSYETSHDEVYDENQQQYDLVNQDSYEQQTYNASGAVPCEQQLYNSFLTDHEQLPDSSGQQIPVECPTTQLSFNTTEAPDKYSITQASEHDESYRSGESLNRAMNETFTQGDYYVHLPPPPESQASQFPAQVPEFSYGVKEGREECDVDQGQLTDESYQQTQFAEEFRRARTPVVEQDSILVCETPIRNSKKQARSLQDENLGYDQWFDQESEVRQADVESGVQECGKRRRLTHYHR